MRISVSNENGCENKRQQQTRHASAEQCFICSQTALSQLYLLYQSKFKKLSKASTDVTLINRELRAILIYICNKTSVWVTRVLCYTTYRRTQLMPHLPSLATGGAGGPFQEGRVAVDHNHSTSATIHHGTGRWSPPEQGRGLDPNNTR